MKVKDEVSEALKALGERLRETRLQRNATMAELGEMIGVDRHVIAAVERGQATTGIGAYAGVLWALDELGTLERVAEVASRARTQRKRGTGDDFPY